MDCSVELLLILELIGILEFYQGRGLIYSSDDLEDDQTRNKIITNLDQQRIIYPLQPILSVDLSAASILVEKRTDCFLSYYLAKHF